ncbi:hypothetical protein HUS91_02020 [Pseudomonas chlororaphis]|uniref:Lipoprotein n=1 Tax=Pseudomonas chlororaphis TaxID=587753 RepID=A0AAX3FN35_9PSED|nr:hypothetical protein [Pseudomonas chlororaphis]AZC37464.1 hypothetical protein C4K37_3077 [Pseudomonas chlororaphis subsp. piscium]AZC44013.1 hypothetical protein C4K36_3088 [Pseudomonas chlororaphis subsp. piscium]AZC50667.1 hypothetical protein C4K35_3084 [Pseudomonas chlororaphis subsp. piscium]AZC63461.1 hypothetical protein C4K33_2969 [Pseudomonas chlororaphis subsp. piscium]AZC69699.1 hypothetical protein C4K32_3037 [Pseudomonas chlororaphis subsp. piscium]
MRTFWLLCFVFLVGCDDSPSEGIYKVKSEVKSINIQLGSPVEDLLKQSPVKFSSDCLAAANICWHEINQSRDDQNLLSVSITQPKSTLELDQVVSLGIVADDDISKDIEEIEVTLRGLPDNSTHEENRVLVYSLIDKLKSAGWHKYYFPSDPRIPGTELDKFDWKKSIFGRSPLSHPLFDPNRKMSLEQWIGSDMLYDWYLYSGDYLAHIKVLRNSAVASTETGTYLIKIELTSLNTFWQNSFEEEERPNWKKLFPEHLKTLLLLRSEAESKARTAGVEIDQSYQAPAMEQVD